MGSGADHHLRPRSASGRPAGGFRGGRRGDYGRVRPPATFSGRSTNFTSTSDPTDVVWRWGGKLCGAGIAVASGGRPGANAGRGRGGHGRRTGRLSPVGLAGRVGVKLETASPGGGSESSFWGAWARCAETRGAASCACLSSDDVSAPGHSRPRWLEATSWQLYDDLCDIEVLLRCRCRSLRALAPDS